VLASFREIRAGFVPRKSKTSPSFSRTTAPCDTAKIPDETPCPDEAAARIIATAKKIEDEQW
jgi:hypothetical protein